MAVSWTFGRAVVLFLDVVLGAVLAGIGLLGYLLLAYLISLRRGPFHLEVLAVLGVIGVLATAFLVAGAKKIRDGIRSFLRESDESGEPLSEAQLAAQPWLRNRDWRKREIVHGQTVRGSIVVLAFIFFVGPFLLLAWAVAFSSSGGSRGGALPPLIVALGIGAMVVIPLAYWWLRHRRYGDSVCRLLTLPGIVGDWFKADVECALPPGIEEPVVVRLKNLVPGGRRLVERWRMEERLVVPALAGARSVVPVRLQVPRHRDQVHLRRDRGSWARFWLGEGAVWHLEIEKKTAGVDFFAFFSVPIYEPANASPSEQGNDTGDRVRQGAVMDKSLKFPLIALGGTAAIEFLAAAVVQLRLFPFLQGEVIRFGRAGNPIPADQFVAWAIPILLGLGLLSIALAVLLVVSRRNSAG